MGWTDCQGILEVSLETCVLATLGLHSAHDPLPVLALQFLWHHGGLVKAGLEFPGKCRMLLAPNKDSLWTGVIKRLQLCTCISRFESSRWISCALLMMAVCVQVPEYCFLPLVSLEIFNGIEIIWNSFQCLNYSAVFTGTVCLGSGPTLVDSSGNQHWFRWAWAQVTSTYKQSIFITVEVYSDLVKYLQNYAALSLLAVCSCRLIPSVKSGSLSSPHLFSTPAFLKTPLNFFAPFVKTDGETL